MRVLIHCPSSTGGIAEYVHCQAKSFAHHHHDVLVLCPVDFLRGRDLDYPVSRIYGSLARQKKSRNPLVKAISLVRRVATYLVAYWQLLWTVVRRRPDFVLFDSYIEYLSPLWVWPHFVLAKFFGVVYVANLHDPVRDFVVGPRWWHELSVKMGFWPIKICVIHHPLNDAKSIPPHVKTVVAPHGLYEMQESPLSPDEIRREWGIHPDGVVYLSFGFIRDNKNLDLVIRALAQVPQAYLVVLGSAQSSKNRPLSFYRDLANAEGVADRVIFKEAFIPDEHIPAYFAAADVAVLTYSKTFHSQSGVLNLAVRARCKVLASSGDSPLKSAVLRFGLGEFVQPDNLQALASGMLKLAREHSQSDLMTRPDWAGYEQYASWDTNTEMIVSAVTSLVPKLAPSPLHGSNLVENGNRISRK